MNELKYEQASSTYLWIWRAMKLVVAGLLIVLLIGFIQDYYNNPMRGCIQFKTDTQYAGYHCKGYDAFTGGGN